MLGILNCVASQRGRMTTSRGLSLGLRGVELHVTVKAVNWKIWRYEKKDYLNWKIIPPAALKVRR